MHWQTPEYNVFFPNSHWNFIFHFQQHTVSFLYRISERIISIQCTVVKQSTVNCFKILEFYLYLTKCIVGSGSCIFNPKIRSKFRYINLENPLLHFGNDAPLIFAKFNWQNGMVTKKKKTIIIIVIIVVVIVIVMAKKKSNDFFLELFLLLLLWLFSFICLYIYSIWIASLKLLTFLFFFIFGF